MTMNKQRVYEKTYPLRQEDWSQLYQDLLTESKTSGYTELNNFLNKYCSGVEKNSTGHDTYWLDLENYRKKEYAYNKQAKVLIRKEERKAIRDQARSLGVRVFSGIPSGCDNMSLKVYKK